jgi:hypothetical protein
MTAKKTTGQVIYLHITKRLRILNKRIKTEDDKYNIGRRDELLEMLPMLCCDCNEINRGGRWVAPRQTMCKKCIKKNREV